MIPHQLREELSNDPWYHECARKDMFCQGRTTWEHALTWQGRALQERFAIIPLCEQHHLGLLLDKRKNREIALRRMTEDDKIKYPRLRTINGFAYLDKKP